MENEKNVFFFRFEELRIYNKALEYVTWVYNNVSSFPEQVQRGLVAKFISSSQSIAINIAEGSGRNKTQFIYYLKMAKSSIRECLVLTTISSKLGYLDDTKVEESRTTLIELTKMIGALIASLQRSEKQEHRADDDEDEDDDMPAPSSMQ